MSYCGFCKKPTDQPTITMKKKVSTDPAFNVEFCQSCYRRWWQQRELAEFELSTFVGRGVFRSESPEPPSPTDRCEARWENPEGDEEHCGLIVGHEPLMDHIAAWRVQSIVNPAPSEPPRPPESDAELRAIHRQVEIDKATPRFVPIWQGPGDAKEGPTEADPSENARHRGQRTAPVWPDQSTTDPEPTSLGRLQAKAERVHTDSEPTMQRMSVPLEEVEREVAALEAEVSRLSQPLGPEPRPCPMDGDDPHGCYLNGTCLGMCVAPEPKASE